MTLRDEYYAAKTRKTDINEHLPTLFSLALECGHITEMGVRTGESTRALLYGASCSTHRIIPIVRSYDLNIDWSVVTLFQQAKRESVDVSYIIGNSLTVDIEPTDFLFIDTDHRYEQLTGELERHAPQVSQYIAMHDTYTMGLGAKDTEPRGLLTAIIDFLIRHPNEWAFHSYATYNNGLTVLHRIDI